MRKTVAESGNEKKRTTTRQKKQRAPIDPSWLTIFVSAIDGIEKVVSSKVGLNMTQARILLEVDYERNTNRIGEVANTLSLRPNTVTAATDALEASGLLTREKEATDRRAIKLVITKKGHETALGILDAFEIYREKLEAILTDKEFELVTDVSKKLACYDTADYRDADDNVMIIPTCIISVSNAIACITLAARRSHLSFSEFRVLFELFSIGEKARVSTVANRLRLRPNVITVAADQLEKRNLIARHEDPSDRRATLLSPTKQGEDIFNQILLEFDRMRVDSEALPANPPEGLTSAFAMN